MSASYLITSPNPKFSGKTLGIQFAEGKAVLHQSMLDRRLNLPMKDIVAQFGKSVEEGGFGYKVKSLDGKKDEPSEQPQA